MAGTWTTPTQVSDGVAWPASEINPEVIDNLAYVFDTGAQIGFTSWTGDGNDDRSISGLAFDPEAVFIWDDESGGQSLIFWWPGMAADAAQELHGGTAAWSTDQADMIQSMGTQAFVIGADADVNYNGRTYHAMYMRTDLDTA